MTTKFPSRGSGLPYALATYLIWGLFPLYFAALHHVPPFEIVGWRVLFTIPFCFAVVSWRSQWALVREAVVSPRTLGILTASALFIGANWLIYVWAVQSGHVLAASLGYYINPLLNVLAGTLFLREKLSRLQWGAVGLATLGVIVLAWDAREMLWISMSLALCFCAYGLLRKLAPVEALPGLTVETLVLLVPGLVLIALQAETEGLSLGASVSSDVLIALSGVLTGLPLLLFAEAARRMDYSTLGFVQYLSPTLVFILGLFVFREPIKATQIVCFGLIWLAIAVFTLDLFQRSRSR